MVRRSSLFPLNENDEVLPATFRSGIFTRALSNSSVSPSAKYSCSGSLLMFVKGSTARELTVLGRLKGASFSFVFEPACGLANRIRHRRTAVGERGGLFRSASTYPPADSAHGNDYDNHGHPQLTSPSGSRHGRTNTRRRPMRRG